MATVTRSRKAREFTCSLVSMTIEINDVRYSVDQTDPGSFGTKSFRLTRHSARDGGCYDVIRRNPGVVACDCPDYVARHEGNGYGLCKHGRALVTLGLLPAPIAVEFEPPVAACVCSTCEDAPAPAPESIPSSDLLDPADSEADPELWGDEWDAFVWNPTAAPVEIEPTAEDPGELEVWKQEITAREHLDASATLTLAELVDRQTNFYRGWGNPAGEMFVRAMEKLALQVRMTESTTPAEFLARIEVLDRDVREQWEAIGYEEGKAACPCRGEAAGSAFGHMA